MLHDCEYILDGVIDKEDFVAENFYDREFTSKWNRYGTRSITIDLFHTKFCII